MGFPKIRPVKGMVVAVTDRDNPQMIVRLESGDHVIQQIEYDRHAWVAFKIIEGY